MEDTVCLIFNGKQFFNFIVFFSDCDFFVDLSKRQEYNYLYLVKLSRYFYHKNKTREKTMYIELYEIHLFMHSMKPYIIGASIPVGIMCFVLYYAWSQNEGKR